MTWVSLFTHTLNGLAFGMLLFILSSGLTVSLGLMRSVNLVHGSFYMIGGFIGFSVFTRTGNYWLSLLAATITVGVGGILLQRLLIDRMKGQHLPEILLTIGIAMALQDASLWVWGGAPYAPPDPPLLSGKVTLFGVGFPAYRLGLIVLGALLAAGLGLALEATRLGAMVRASVDDQEIARSMGIKVPKLLAFVAGLAAALAGFAGLWGGAFTGLYIGVDFEMVLLAFIIVILGGVGSLRGALVASIYVGLLNEFGRTLFPSLAQFTLYAPVVAVLAVRPQGFFGRLRI